MNHDQDHSEMVVQYALNALPPSEVAGVQARLAACEDCRKEMEALRPLVASFVAWPTDVLRPSVALWDRLAERIGAPTGPAPEPSAAAQPEWQEPGPGISCKVLATDTERNRVTLVVRLAPGTDYPPHRHAGVEELHLLDGELKVDDKTLYPGDYLRSEPGTVDHRVWSETGCTCVLLTSVRDVLL